MYGWVAYLKQHGADLNVLRDPHGVDNPLCAHHQALGRLYLLLLLIVCRDDEEEEGSRSRKGEDVAAATAATIYHYNHSHAILPTTATTTTLPDYMKRNPEMYTQPETDGNALPGKQKSTYNKNRAMSKPW